MTTLNINELLGAWRCADGFSGVIVHITDENGELQVIAVDENDGEEAEIYNIRQENGSLAFCTHWQSNGRFIKYRFQVTEECVADVCFSYSTQETWLKLRT